jgi:hypothetical protein
LSEQYVADVLEVCLAVIEESSDASTEIQRIWRGYKARQAYLNRPRKRPFQRPVPKVPKKVSHSEAVWCLFHKIQTNLMMMTMIMMIMMMMMMTMIIIIVLL